MVSPVCVLVSPFRSLGGPIEWRGVVCVVVSPSSRCPRFSCIVPFLFVCVLPCVLRVGKCGGVCCFRGTVVSCRRRWCVLFYCEWLYLSFSLLPLCVRCHSIVGLVWCLSVRVVLLRNGGGVMGVWFRCLVLSVFSLFFLCWCSG